MYLNVKYNIIFFLLFLLANVGVYTFNVQQKNLDIEQELHSISQHFQTSFLSINNDIFNEAKSTHSIITGEDVVIEIISEASQSDKHNQQFLQEKLYKHLQPLYNILKTDGVKNLHFILANEESFLQMNKEKSFCELKPRAQELKDATFEFCKDLETLNIKYIFPLFNEENHYLGYYEIIYSLSFLQNLMFEVDSIQTEILSPEDTYAFSKKEKLFSILQEGNVDSFLSLENPQEKRKIAYLKATSTSPYIEETLLRFNTISIVSFFILILIFALMYWLALNRARVLEERERFQLAIDSSNDGIWDWNIEKNTTYFSPRFLQMLGFEENELELDFQMLENKIHPEDKIIFISQINALMNKEKTILDCEYRIQHKSGKWIWVHNRAKAHFSNTYKPLRVVGFHSDITLKKEYESNQEKLIEELQNVASAKSNFLANMSHEIRTPMNAILGFIQILIRNETDPKKLQKFNIINESGKLLLKIINDVLDFSKLDTKKLLIEKIPYEIRKTFHHLQNLFQLSAQEKSLEIILEIDEKLPKYTLGDKIRVEQIVSNLLSNAIKFSTKSNKIILKIIYLQDENAMRCEVSDFGIGIAQHKLEDIFSPFTQEDSSTTRKFGGTGLGLSISKELCELMDGTIGVKSTLGEGSTFYFTLPLYKVNCNLDDSSNVTSLPNSAVNGNILIVEDNKTNQLFLTTLLDEYNLTYRVANDGVQALEVLTNETFDLILMDENMPNMNGIEATNIIRKTDLIKEIPIIAVTANALDGDRERFINAGMDAYIAKPINSQELHNVLCKYLSGKKRS